MCLAHFLNDLLQSLLIAIFPILKDSFNLDFAQIGYIVLAFQLTASLLQPGVGYFTDKRPMPYGLAVGMAATLIGLIMLAYASNYAALLFAAAMVGTGSSIFHPEGSRVARMASGGRHGLAQSIFQVGGNFGQAAGPLLAAFIIVPLGQRGIVWFAFVALFAIFVLARIGRWYKAHMHEAAARTRREAKAAVEAGLVGRKVAIAIAILMALMFSKAFYGSALSTFYTFYLIETFGVSVRDAQLYLFLHMAAVAVGVLYRRAAGRLDGPQEHHLVLDPGRAAVHRRASVREPCGRSCPHRAHRPHHGRLDVADPRLRAGTRAAQGRHDGGAVLRIQFRHGRAGAAVLGHVADLTSLSFVFKLVGVPARALACCAGSCRILHKRRASA